MPPGIYDRKKTLTIRGQITKHFLQQLAEVGARDRVKALRHELDVLFAAFPALANGAGPTPEPPAEPPADAPPQKGRLTPRGRKRLADAMRARWAAAKAAGNNPTKAPLGKKAGAQNEPGIQRGTKYIQANVKHAGRRVWKKFPLTTPLNKVRAWRTAKLAELSRTQPGPSDSSDVSS